METLKDMRESQGEDRVLEEPLGTRPPSRFLENSGVVTVVETDGFGRVVFGGNQLDISEHAD